MGPSKWWGSPFSSVFWFCLLGLVWLNFWAVCWQSWIIRWFGTLMGLSQKSNAFRSGGGNFVAGAKLCRGSQSFVSWLMFLIIKFCGVSKFSLLRCVNGGPQNTPKLDPLTPPFLAKKGGVKNGISQERPCRNLIFLILLVSGGFRFGEALNPGPQSSDEWCLGTFNPTGLTSKADVVASIGGDVWGVTETHLSYEGCRKFRHGLRCNKTKFTYCIPGAHCPLRKRSKEVGNFSGVACLSRWPVRALPHNIDPAIYKTARVQIYGVCVQQLWITMGVMYGYPESLSHQYPRYHTEVLLEQIIDRVGLQCKGPRVVMGDFNWSSSELTQLRRLESLGFKDLQVIANEWWGVDIQPTGKGDRVLDYVYVSPELFPLIANVIIDPTQWPDHSSVMGRFRGGFNNLRELRWRVPSKVDWPDGDWIQNLPLPSGDVSKDFAECWQSLEAQANKFHVDRGKAPWHASQFGRGQTLDTVEFTPPRAPVKKGRSGESQPQFFGGSWRYAQRYRQLRRFHCLVRSLRKHPNCVPASLWQLWKAIRWSSGYSQGFCGWWQSCGIPLIAQLELSQREGLRIASAPTVAPGSAEEASWALRHQISLWLNSCFRWFNMTSDVWKSP